MEHKRALCAYFNPLQTNYIHVHMSDSQEVLGNAVVYSFIQKSAAVRFFEYAANSAGGEILGGGRRNLARGAKPVTLFYWMKSKVYPKCCYVLCLTKESVITATLVHAPVCVCVCVCVRVWVIRVRLKYQVEAGPDFEKPWSIITQSHNNIIRREMDGFSCERQQRNFFTGGSVIMDSYFGQK